VGWSLEELSKAGETLEGTSPDGRSTIVHDEACWFSERLSGIGDSTGAIAVIAVPNREVFDFALDLRIGMFQGLSNNYGW